MKPTVYVKTLFSSLQCRLQFSLLHQVLSDSERRARYDAGEDEDGGMSSSGMGGMHGFHGGFDPNDIANIFMQFGGGGGGFRFRTGGAGNAHGFEF